MTGMSITFEKAMTGMTLWTDMMRKCVPSRFKFDSMYFDTDDVIMPSSWQENRLVALVTSLFGWDDMEYELHAYIITRLVDSGVELLFVTKYLGCLQYVFYYRYDCCWFNAKSYAWLKTGWRRERFLGFTDEFAFLMHSGKDYIALGVEDVKKVYVETKSALTDLLGWGLK